VLGKKKNQELTFEFTKRSKGIKELNAKIEEANSQQWVFDPTADSAMNQLLALVGRHVDIVEHESEVLAWMHRTASREQLAALRAHVFQRAMAFFVEFVDASSRPPSIHKGDSPTMPVHSESEPITTKLPSHGPEV